MVAGNGMRQCPKHRGVMRRHGRRAGWVNHLYFDLLPDSVLHFREKRIGIHLWH